MYIKNIMHVEVEESYSEAELDASLTEAICELGGNVIEIQDHEQSIYDTCG